MSPSVRLDIRTKSKWEQVAAESGVGAFKRLRRRLRSLKKGTEWRIHSPTVGIDLERGRK